MKKHARILIAVLTVLVMVGTLCSCGTTSAAGDVFAGELVDVQYGKIAVRGETATMQFDITDATTYELDGDTELFVGDGIEIKYHEESGNYIADNVKVVQHTEKKLVLAGQVTDLTKTSVTIKSESLTVVFDYDEETQVDGALSKGDVVTVTYDGDLSEHPYAVSIVVVENMREEALITVHGTVAEVAKDSVMLSLDSADAYRFEITEDTIISGDDTKLKVGDRARIVYTGNIEEIPVARTITIHRNKEQDKFVLDGVISEVSVRTVKVQTKEATYTFKVNDKTKIENKEYLKKSHRTTITYTGKLKKKPVAVSIYCSKEQVKAKKQEKATKKTKKTQATKATKETKKTETKKTETKKTDPTEEPITEETETQEPITEETETQAPETQETETQEPETQETETQAPEGDPVGDMIIVKVNGTIKTWGDKCEIKVEGGGIIKLDSTDAGIPGGYLPQAEDEVIASYDQSDMKLLDLQLVYRPAETEEQ